MNCEAMIYLDSEFLSKKYEDENDEPVMTSLIRDEGLQAGIRIPFASGGAHTKEVKSYSVSVYGMYKGLTDSLRRYPEIESVNENTHGTVCWVRGRLYVGHHRHTRQSNGREEVLEDGYFFELEFLNSQNLVLITQISLFEKQVLIILKA